jgi:hypothetical protein
VDPCPFALPAEDVQDLRREVAVRAEPMWLGGVEFGGVAGPERDLALAEDQQ